MLFEQCVVLPSAAIHVSADIALSPGNEQLCISELPRPRLKPAVIPGMAIHPGRWKSRGLIPTVEHVYPSSSPKIPAWAKQAMKTWGTRSEKTCLFVSRFGWCDSMRCRKRKRKPPSKEWSTKRARRIMTTTRSVRNFD